MGDNLTFRLYNGYIDMDGFTYTNLAIEKLIRELAHVIVDAEKPYNQWFLLVRQQIYCHCSVEKFQRKLVT